MMPTTNSQQADAPRPNVIVMLTDDHASWALGTYGNREVRTPSIDYLASTGVQFDNAFTPIPVCSPARATFWTGRMPSQHGIHDYLADNTDPEVAAVPWLQNETTLAMRLKAAGYTTAMVGKWHLGPTSAELAEFDYFFTQSGPAPTPTAFSGTIHPPSSLQDGHFDRHAITDHAINFLRNRDNGKPFFLFIGHFATHSPWENHPPRLVEQYRRCSFDDIHTGATYPFGRLKGEATRSSRNQPREAAAQYYASVSVIDEQVGRVVDELEAQCLRDSTAIIYTSDHGLNAGQHGLWGKGNATYPYNMLEESIRIPLVINAPGRVLGGQRRAEPATLCDLHETILDVTGIEVFDRKELSLPGRSLLPLCRGQAIEDWPDAVFGEYGDLRMVRTATHKLIRRYGARRGELFDLEKDPREGTNVLGKPAYSLIEADLDARLGDFFSGHEEPLVSGLRVAKLPRHNRDEAWRENGVHQLVSAADWINLAAVQTSSKQ